MDVVHQSLESALPVVSRLPLTPIETQVLVLKLEGPNLCPFDVERQTALTAALQLLLLTKTNTFLLNITQVSVDHRGSHEVEEINELCLDSRGVAVEEALLRMRSLGGLTSVSVLRQFL